MNSERGCHMSYVMFWRKLNVFTLMVPIAGTKQKCAIVDALWMRYFMNAIAKLRHKLIVKRTINFIVLELCVSIHSTQESELFEL